MEQADTQNEKLHISGTKVSVERYFFVSSFFIAIVFAWLEPEGASGIGVFKGVVFWITQFLILIPLPRELFSQRARERTQILDVFK